MLVLAARDVERALSMPEAIEAASAAYAALSSGRARVPARMAVQSAATLEAAPGTLLVMPGYLEGPESLGAKLITVYPGNPSRGLPLLSALLLLFDPGSGRPLAAVEAARLTALRTGAGSGVATKLLALPGAATAAVIGAGVQGRTQLEAVCAVRPIRRARVFDLDPARAAAFCAEMSERLDRIGHRLRVEPAASAREAVEEAEVVVTATTSRDPVLQAGWLQPGAHINAIGSYTPDMSEVGLDVLRRAGKVVVDCREAVLKEAGEFTGPIQRGEWDAGRIHAEVGEVVLGLKPGRERPDEITLYKAVGHAVLDLAVGALAFRRARELGLGVEVDL
ncbi:MAG: ornithine cyclodeaminase family protein [Acetobacteraceae bacterium]|nr:ornithine cyclodeaminase family protein [Acetobacteraceae bacterium]